MMLWKVISACVLVLVVANATAIRHSNTSDRRPSYRGTAALIRRKARWGAGTSFTRIHSHVNSQCWNKPPSKAIYEIFVKHRRNYTTISNTSVAAVSAEIERSDGKMRFEESPVASTYLLVGLLVPDLRNASDSGGTIKIEAFLNNFRARMPQVAKNREQDLEPTETTVRRICSRSRSQVNASSPTSNATSRGTRQSLPSLARRVYEPTSDVDEDFFLLPQQVMPVHYNIRLIPHIAEGNFTSNGETSIDVKVLEPTDVVVLHIMELTIDESQTRMTCKDEHALYYVPKRHDYNNRSEILTLQFDKPLDIGVYTLYLKFMGVISSLNHGLYRSFYIDNEGNKVWLAVTHFQPVHARQAFPCWDEPAMKATFKLSIKHYPNYTALSNMPSSQSQVDETDGKVWTRFETTPVMPTNVLGFVIADYDHISNLDDTMRIWGPKHLLHLAAFPLDIAEKATHELEKFTNSTIPVPKMDHVVAPHYSSRATENWGMIVYRLDTLLYDDNTPFATKINNVDSIDFKRFNVMTITHELAHQWFGNLVSPTWWNYLWLSEGISTYLKFYITDKFLNEWRLMDFFVVEGVQATLDRDVSITVPIHRNITSDIRTAYTYLTYTKSAVLLRMMSNFLTEDVFRNGLIKYLRANAYGNTTPDDLWKAMQNALDESDVPHNDFNVKEVMDAWFEQPNYPIVTIERDYTNGDIKATQKGVYSRDENSEKWWIPLNFATQTDLNFSSTLATHWLRPQDEAVTIEGVDVDHWIIVNKQLTGLYRVNYDLTNWKRIAAFLNSDDYVKIPALNRAQIINDASFLMISRQLDVITFLEITNYLSREIDCIVWQPVLKILQTIDTYFQVPESAAIARPFVFNLTRKILEKIGFDDRPDDDPSTLRTRFYLGQFACKYGHAECQAKATAKVLAYVEDPIANKIPRNLQWILCFGLMKASDTVWDKFLQVQNLTLEHHLTFLGCTENMNIVEKHINYINTSEYESSQKYMYYEHIALNILKNPSNIDRAIDYFINNSDRLNDFIRVSSFDVRMFSQSVTENQFTKMRIYSKQRYNRPEFYPLFRENEVAKVKNNSAKIRNALENNQFSVPMHITLDNSAS
ncbi:aminopeptidase N-like isoform X2 [Odontomachus brunneus]|uniref:aminopeptidase N-like isoform X2 n=1 Tax=Odontomachus brunneus TaxID=486640 RepID=UPI0013F23B1F|nr:aminopeptidase N-like isoform X2 [Odontomachus brunneus]